MSSFALPSSRLDRKTPGIGFGIPSVGTTALDLDNSSRPPPTPSTELQRYKELLTNNIYADDTWKTCFARSKATPPTEIISGLYISNQKTAAAYLLGEISTDQRSNGEYPNISRILTVMPVDQARLKLPEFPNGSDIRPGIKHKYIDISDTREAPIIQYFDETGEFIHEGIRAYCNAQREESMSEITAKLTAVRPRDSSSSNRWDLGPTSPIRISKSSPTLSMDPYKAAGTSSRAPPSAQPHPVAPFEPADTFHRRSITCPNPTAGGVLVHCHAGISRSATVVIAYLMKYHSDFFKEKLHPRLTSDKDYPNPASTPRLAFVDEDKWLGDKKKREQSEFIMPLTQFDRIKNFVQEKRPIVNPNPGFAVQLNKYDQLGCSLRDENGEFKGEFLDWWDETEDGCTFSGLVRKADGGNSVFRDR